MEVNKQTVLDLIKLYNSYKFSEHYHPQTDLGSFIAYLEWLYVHGQK